MRQWACLSRMCWSTVSGGGGAAASEIFSPAAIVLILTKSIHRGPPPTLSPTIRPPLSDGLTRCYLSDAIRSVALVAVWGKGKIQDAVERIADTTDGHAAYRSSASHRCRCTSTATGSQVRSKSVVGAGGLVIDSLFPHPIRRDPCAALPSSPHRPMDATRST